MTSIRKVISQKIVIRSVKTKEIDVLNFLLKKENTAKRREVVLNLCTEILCPWLIICKEKWTPSRMVS